MEEQNSSQWKIKEKIKEILNKRLKKKDQLFNLMFLMFHFLYSSVPNNKCHKPKWHVAVFTCIKLVVCMLVCLCVCVCDDMHQMEQKANSDFSMFWRLLKPETLFVDKVLHLHLTKKYFSTSVCLLNTLFSVLSHM